MRRVGRVGVSVAMALALILPFGDLTAPLLLALAADIAVAGLIIRRVAEARARHGEQTREDIRLTLLRRTVPHLRQRRPTAVIEMQIRWRARAEAAAARRRGTL
jgi:hypothetical protein